MMNPLGGGGEGVGGGELEEVIDDDMRELIHWLHKKAIGRQSRPVESFKLHETR